MCRQTKAARYEKLIFDEFCSGLSITEVGTIRFSSSIEKDIIQVGVLFRAFNISRNRNQKNRKNARDWIRFTIAILPK